MNNKLYLFGLGTGRCGTVSLSKLLNAQHRVRITHEQKPWLPWILNEETVKSKVVSLRKRSANTVGDVALFNLQSVETLLGLLPNAKFIVLKREKKETVASFARKWKRTYNRICFKRNKWDNVYPQYQLPLLQALNKYYDEYYKKVFESEEKYPSSVKCFNMNMLNSRKGITAILDFCRIPEKRRTYRVGIKENQGRRTSKKK